MNKVLSMVAVVGKSAIAFAGSIGGIAIFSFKTLISMFFPPFYWRTFTRQIWVIGYYSLPVIGLTAIFTGAVLALQSYIGFNRMSAGSGAITSIVVLSITRELGPVLTGLMIAGRVGAAIAAEIGTMRVTEQIDALYTLGTDPVKYLIVPRVAAAGVVMPILVLIADVIGVFGGYLASTYKLGLSPYGYLRDIDTYLCAQDIWSSVVKAFAFGVIVSLVSCYHGYNSRGGAQGVGIATTSSVVTSSILILLADYLITGVLF